MLLLYVIVLHFERLGSGHGLLEIYLQLVSEARYRLESVCMIALSRLLFLLGRVGIGQQVLAFLQDLVVRDDLLVLVALVLREGIGILCLVPEPAKLLLVDLPFLLQRPDEILLLDDDLFERPGSSHPHLQLLLDLLIPHLPPLDLLADPACLLCQTLDLSL